MFVGYLIAVLDGICTGIDRSLYADLIDRVDGNLEVLAVCLFNDRCKLRNGEIFIGRNLDQVDVLKGIPPNCLSGMVCSVN